MTTQEEQFMARWATFRKGGRWRFGLLYGSLWGGMLALFSQFLYLFNHSVKEVYLRPTFYIILAVLVLLGVLGFSVFLWKWAESRYQRLLEEK